MDCNNEQIRLMVKQRVSDTFIKIINDLPDSDFNPQKNALIVQKNSELITSMELYNILHEYITNIIPKKSDNTKTIIKKIIFLIPGTIKDLVDIKNNVKIISYQNQILNKYFTDTGEFSIKEKISDLEKHISNLVEKEDLEYLDIVLSNFSERVHSELLKDLEVLSVLLKKKEPKLESVER